MCKYLLNFRKILFFALALAFFISFASVPALAVYEDEPEINSPAVLLYETKSGKMLYSRGADEKHYPASTTKIMTALLALKYCSMDEIVTYTKEARAGLNKDSSLAGLKTGEYMSLYNMLKCMLVASGNDAANAIAIHVGGSISKFVDMMNEEAQELGCENTHFVNPHGLHDEEHYTSANDLLKITLAAREYDVFREIVSCGQVTVPSTNKYDKERVFNNTNMLLNIASEGMYLYSKATGIKTGHTSEAGYCLVSSAKNDDFDLVCVVLGGYTYVNETSKVKYITAYQDSLRLYRWAFSSFKWYPVLSTGNMITEIKVEQGDDKDHIILSPTENVNVIIHKDEDPSEIYTTIISTEQSVVAPVERGSIHGTITVMKGSEVFARVNLAAVSSVKASTTIHAIAVIRDFFTGQWVNAIIITIIVAACCYGLFLIYYNTKRSKHRRRRR